MARGNFVDDGINIRENNNVNDPVQRSSRRPDMKGPSDISDILSGLKTKQVNIHESKDDENDSMISISSLKDLQDNNMPKRSRRKPRSDKNTVSLDI
jgi:hypothetical protein